MKKLILTACLLLAACSGKPAPALYRLEVPATAQPACSAGPSIAIKPPVAGPGLDSARIVVMEEAGRQTFYNDVRWNASAPELVQHNLAERFEASGRFATVITDDAAAHTRWLLQTQLRRFQVDEAGGRKVQIAITATLVRADDRQAILTLPLTFEQDAEGANLEGIVALFDSGMGQISDQLLAAIQHKISLCH